MKASSGTGRIETMLAAGLGLEALAALFTDSFRDYVVPMTMSAAAMGVHVATNGIDLAASCILRVDGQPSGVALLGRRGRRGWVGGIGIVPERRGQGLGRRLMMDLIASARRSGLGHVQLEVFVTNAPAASLYRDLGFMTRRRLVGMEGPPVPAAEPGELAPPGILPAPLADPCWQREPAALRNAPDLQVIRLGGEAVACRVVGGQVRIVGASTADRPGVRRLLGALSARHPGLPFSISNEPADSALAGTLRALGWRETYAQDEMVLELGPL